MNVIFKKFRHALMKRKARRDCKVDVRTQPAKIPADAPVSRLAICAIVKNEEAYIEEWIEFHRLVGVDHFYLYDNGSDDKTPCILERYQERGIVDLCPWPNFSTAYNAQFTAYAHCAHIAAGQATWVAFIDVDEFLYSEQANNLSDAIDAVADEQTSAIGVCRHEYGPCGHKTKPDGLVIENYTERPLISADTKIKIKTIARPERIVSVSSAHLIGTGGGLTVDSTGHELESKSVRGSTAHFTNLRVNHYYTKSHEEFTAKLARGRMTDKPMWEEKALEKIIEIERSPSTKDVTAARFADELKARGIKSTA